MAPLADPFTALRPRLFGIAYRMLGSRADAEDVLQEAWLRWHRTDVGQLASAEAWLVIVVTRLAIDRLREAKKERESYVGHWLPEPLVADPQLTPEQAVEQADDISVAFLLMLERLSADERAAFLLRQVFDHDYSDIARLLDKNEAACRQLVHRASERVRRKEARFDVAPTDHRRLLEQFVMASRSGRLEPLTALLADDVQLVSDGGGKVSSFMKVLGGARRIAQLYYAVNRRLGQRMAYQVTRINGGPGLLRLVDGVIESAQAFDIENGRITAIYTVRNPDKLQGIVVTNLNSQPS
jgi:RNA polymerase sigma-70 factor (ECF subfamily)